MHHSNSTEILVLNVFQFLMFYYKCILILLSNSIDNSVFQFVFFSYDFNINESHNFWCMDR